MNSGLFSIITLVFVLFSAISYIAGVYMTKRLLLDEYHTLGNIFIDDRIFVEETYRSQAHIASSLSPTSQLQDECTKYPKTPVIRAACEDYIAVCLSEAGKEDKQNSYFARQKLEDVLETYHQMRKEAVAFQRLQARSPYKVAGL